MSEKKEERVVVMPPNPPPQQRPAAPQAGPQAGPVVGGLDDPGSLKSKETIPGGLYINDSGYYVNANREFVDKTGKVIEKDKDGNIKPVKARRGETPVQDHQAAIEKNPIDQPDEDEG